MSQQILLEVGKFFGHGDTLLGAFHELLQLGRNLNLVTNDAFYGFEELGGMGRLEEYTHFTGLQSFGQGTIAACAMRVEQITSLRLCLFYRLTNLFVCVGRTTNLGLDGSMTVSVQFYHTGKVAGVAHIHSIGNRGH